MEDQKAWFVLGDAGGSVLGDVLWDVGAEHVCCGKGATDVRCGTEL